MDYVNENPQSEALLPLFANLQKRISDVISTGNPFTMPSNSGYWSVTEYGSDYAWNVNFGSGIVYTGYKYGGYVVRPVAAFTFTL